MRPCCVQFLRCPVCGEAFSPAGASLVCAHGHTFDVARQGYVNLLPRRAALPGTLGDSQAMLEARRRMLDAGHFRPVATWVARTVAEHLATGARRYVLDSGCGDGHYLAETARAAAGSGACFLGADIAKPAARMAAARHRELSVIVADVRAGLPLAPGRALAIVDLFAPRNPAEFARLLRDDGLLIVGIPAPDHLAELRERFALRGLAVDEDKEARVVGALSGGFSVRRRHTERFTLDLDAAAAADLVAMTPAARHLAEQVGPREPLRVTAAVVLLAFQRSV